MRKLSAEQRLCKSLETLVQTWCELEAEASWDHTVNAHPLDGHTVELTLTPTTGRVRRLTLTLVGGFPDPSGREYRDLVRALDEQATAWALEVITGHRGRRGRHGKVAVGC